MTPTNNLEPLFKDVQYLLDRLAIRDCAVRHARGCDRYDSALLAGAYHADGLDEHGFAINPGPKYPEWANAAHAERFQTHTHNVFQQVCEIDGDVAHCETYVIGMFKDKEDGDFPIPVWPLPRSVGTSRRRVENYGAPLAGRWPTDGPRLDADLAGIYPAGLYQRDAGRAGSVLSASVDLNSPGTPMVTV